MLAALAATALVIVATAGSATPLPPPRLTEERAVEIMLVENGVHAWVSRYPADSIVTEGTYDETYRDWTVKAWSGAAGQIVFGRVDDLTGLVEVAWTGPQVAWPMARGSDGAFGGKRLNSLPVWLGFCAVFVLGLADLRRLRSVRNLDLLVLVSLSVSLWFFNEGRIFTSVPLVYPVLLYLLVRTLWIGVRDRPPAASRPVWPVWVLAAATMFLGGFRIGLDFADSNVIDVGYSGVIGAHRIASGQAPYGHFPDESGRPCGPPDRNGRVVLRIQDNGRCEGQNEHGDTYGPVTYRRTYPAKRSSPGRGRGTRCTARTSRRSPSTSPAIVGLVLVGLRYGGRRLAATLAFAWAAYPVHAVRRELELQRRHSARAPDLRVLVSLFALGAGKLGRSRVLDEVRAARRRAVVGDVPRAPHPSDRALRRRIRRWRRWRRSGCCCSSPTRSAR